MNKVLMYYQECKSEHYQRLRLVYPNGRVEFYFLWPSGKYCAIYSSNWQEACYIFNSARVRITKTTKQALRAMRAYDKENCWKPAVLIGKL